MHFAERLRRSIINPILAGNAPQLGWVPDPRFRRKALSALPEEDEIRAWRNLRVGLSLRDASHTQHGRELREVRFGHGP
jgi:hypothetical protein